MKRALGVLLLAIGVAVSTMWAGPAAQAAAAKVFKLTSPGHRDNSVMALKNSCANKSNPNCVGENVSPPLEWSDVPDGTKSFALLIYDPEARAGLGFSQLVIYGIPASVTSLAEGAISQASPNFVGGKNQRGISIYNGPGTPPGVGYHHYVFTLIATDLDPKALPPGLSRDELLAKLEGHTKAAAGLILRFKHPSSRRR